MSKVTVCDGCQGNMAHKARGVSLKAMRLKDGKWLYGEGNIDLCGNCLDGLSKIGAGMRK